MSVISAIWGRKFAQLDRIKYSLGFSYSQEGGSWGGQGFQTYQLSAQHGQTKVLANRLAQKVQEIVLHRQSAFIQDRFIKDNFKLVQQTARVLQHQKILENLFSKN